MVNKKILVIIIILLLLLNIFLPIISNANNNIVEENFIETDDENQYKVENEVEQEEQNILENGIIDNEVIKENKTIENNNLIQNNKEKNIENNTINNEVINEEEKIEQNEYGISTTSLETDELGVKYLAHVQDIGWQKYVENGAEAGTTGRNLKIEAMKIELLNNKSNINIKYSSYIQDSGWQNPVQDGQQTGTTGRNLKMEAIKIWLENTNEYSVMYRTHVQDFGWQEWKYDGEISGNLCDNKKIEAIEIKIIAKVESKMSVLYSSHVQDIGWENKKQEYDISGTTGRNLKVEAVTIKLKNAPNGIKLKYKTYVQYSGWQSWAEEDQVSGTTGHNLKIYGIRIKLEGTNKYSIYYRVHIQDEGWDNWKKNGEIAGNIADERKIEAIQIKIEEESHSISNSIGLEYYTYLYGSSINENYIEEDGQISGTTGQNRKMEGIQIELKNVDSTAHIKYKTHIQDVGWVDWSRDGQISGIINKNLKIEAIKIELEGLKDYTIQYKVHVQDIGWTDWYIDGESAGTTGQNKKIEAIQIQIVPKYHRYFKGIDVSHWQGNIDFDKLSSSGQIDFMITKIGWYSETNRKLMVDEKFERNYREAKNKNIPLGAYFYSYATSVDEAKKEAESLVNYLRSSGQTNYELPIFYDVEDKSQIQLGKDIITQMSITFCEVLRKAGFEVGIYSYSYWLENYMYLSQLPEGYSIWVANYGKDNDGSLPEDIYKYSDKYPIWQYSDSGSVSGIDENVDMNICYKKYF